MLLQKKVTRPHLKHSGFQENTTSYKILKLSQLSVIYHVGHLLVMIMITQDNPYYST